MRAILFAAVFCALAAPGRAQDAPKYQTVFYQNAGLRLEGYFYKPAGEGPFPLVVYSHGSRRGEERIELPVAFIGRLLPPAGYAVFVPERRGYGKSDGATFSDEVGLDTGIRFVTRVRSEADDVLAGLEYAVKTFPVDPKRVALMGFSFGGMVTTFAAPRASVAAIVNQAPGALNWNKNAELRRALVEAAGGIRAPMLCMAAENDLTTENVKSICAAAKARGAAAEVIIYPPFTHPRNPNVSAPGHALFSPLGVDHWKNDVLTFLGKRLGVTAAP